MNCSMPDPDKPSLGVRMVREKTVGGCQRVVSDLVSSSGDVGRHNPAYVPRFDLRTDLLIELVAAGQIPLCYSVAWQLPSCFSSCRTRHPPTYSGARPRTRCALG